MNQNSEWVTVSISNLNPSIDDWIGVFSPANFSDSMCFPENPSFSPPYLCSTPIKVDYMDIGERTLFSRIQEPGGVWSLINILPKQYVTEWKRYPLNWIVLSFQAALDVFTVEPPPKDNILVNHEKVTITPLLNASTMEAQEGVAIKIAGALKERTCCYCICF